jgi:hypothetical protein
MVNFDDLRRSTEDDFDFDDDDGGVDTSPAQPQLFLGMTPLERMFISMFLFMNVAVLGIALLLATGRIGS